MSDAIRTRILLVEDEIIIAMAEKTALAKLGYEVELAHSGEAAIAICAVRRDIDLILMDIDLGKGIDGPGAATSILKQHDVPVVFVSSHTEPEIVGKTEKITSYGYVVKNSGITVLNASIKMAFKLFNANRRIAVSEAKQKALIDNISDVISIVDPNGVIQYESSNCEKWFGWKPEETIGRNSLNRVHPDDIEQVKIALFDLLQQDNTLKTVEFRIQCRDGSFKPIELTALNLLNDSTINGVLLNYHDITDRTQLTDALKESEFFFRESQRAGGIGSYKSDYISGCWESSEVLDSIFGIDTTYTRSIDSWLNLVHPDDVEMISRYLNDDVITKRKNFSKEYRIVRWNDGETRWVIGLGEVNFDAAGKITSMIGTIQDITDRRRIEDEIKSKSDELEALNEELNAALEEMESTSEELIASDAELRKTLGVLQESEHRYLELFNSMTEGFALHDLVCDENGSPVDYRFIDVNPAFEKLTGLKRENIIGQLQSQILPDEDPFWLNTYARVALTGEPAHFEHYSHALRLHYEVFSYCPSPETFAVIFGDITDRKNAEDLIRGKNEELESLNNELNASIQEMEAANSELQSALSNMTAVNEKLVNTGEELQKKDAALIESQIRYSLILTAVEDGLWDWNVSTGEAYFSAIYYNMLGYDDMEFPSDYGTWRTLVHPDDIEKTEERIMESIQSGNSFIIDLRMKKKSEEWLWVETRGKMIERSDDGSALRMVGTLSNITERKRIEKEILDQRKLISTILESATEAIYAKDSHGIYRAINEAGAKKLGLTASQIIGHTDLELMPEKSAQAIMKNDLLVLTSRQAIEIEEVVEIEGHSLTFTATKTPWLDNEGLIIGVIGISRDISKHKKIEAELHETNEYLSNLFNCANAPIITWDASFSITRFNHAFERLTGRKQNEVIGMNLDILFPPETRNTSMLLIQDTNQGQRWETVEIPILSNDGEIRIVIWNSANILDAEGYVISTIAQGVDITDRINAERELKEREQSYRTLADSGLALIWTAGTDMLCTYFNKVWLDFTGRSYEQEYGNGWTEGVHSEDFAHCLAVYTESFKQQKKFSMEYRIRRYDGEYRWIQDDGSPRYDSSGKFLGYIGHCFDITERKQADDALKKSEENFKQLVHDMQVGVLLQGPASEIILSNPRALELLGVSEDNLLGKTSLDPSWNVIHEDGSPFPGLTHPVPVAIASHESVRNVIMGVYRPTSKDRVWLHVDAELQCHHDGSVKQVVCTFIDITKRKQSEEKIQILLNEKELILKEVHHRIKNNMNTIKGLLSLQAATMKYPVAEAALEDASSRVQSMMVLYDKLYQSSNFESISLKKYMSSLIDEVVTNFPNSKFVTVTKNIEEIILDVKKVQPLGIIINELLTNIMKYAFPGSGDGSISVTIVKLEDFISIEIMDNGTGLPESIDFENSTGFGLMLVGMLTRQLKGTITIVPSKGTRIRIEFPM